MIIRETYWKKPHSWEEYIEEQNFKNAELLTASLICPKKDESRFYKVRGAELKNNLMDLQ